MLDQRRRRWADVAQMLDKCFVFAGIKPKSLHLNYLIITHNTQIHNENIAFS